MTTITGDAEKVKALFFSQYLYQPVFKIKSRPKETFKLLPFDCGERNSTGYLLLRTVEQLTDEEISIMGNSVGWGISEENKDTVIPWVRKDFKCNMQKYGVYKDLLRLYGVLIDFTYLNEENKPVTLQPSDLIKLGWVKIKEK